ncbi:MAG: hypothetical protein ACT4N4_13735 [Rhodospirillales bacterium]
MIDRGALLPVVVGICMANGIFSPYLAVALQIVPVLMPEAFPKTAEWALFFSSIFVATGTLLLAGVPAALYERFAQPAEESAASTWIWLIGATLLSLPAFDTIEKLF